MVWSKIKSVVSPIFQITVILSALTFCQRQEPLLDEKIDHQTKILTIRNGGLTPVNVRIFAMNFELNLVVDANRHVSIEKGDPIKSLYTNGFIYGPKNIWPFQTFALDLKSIQRVPFQEWDASRVDAIFYCFALEATPWLGKSNVDLILTPKVKFAASLFGPLSETSSVGGGYPKNILATEGQMKADCQTIYLKAR